MFAKKTIKNIECLYCNFKTTKTSNFNRHVATLKHLKNTKSKIDNKKNEIKDQGDDEQEKEEEDNEKDVELSSLCSSSMVLQLMKENNEIKQMLYEQNQTLLQQNNLMMEICKQPTSNIINHNTNTFNLNIFLNEKCKNAMNIADFIHSIEIDLDDLIRVGKVGYVKGITDIILTHLRKLDVTERPLHCSDLKREVMYIKDKDVWEKDNEQKEKFRKVVKEISMINSRALPLYKEKHPDILKHDSKHVDEYDKIVIEALGGIDFNIQPNQNKIMKNIAKEVVINRSCFSKE